jgi:hypothetical protein
MELATVWATSAADDRIRTETTLTAKFIENSPYA